MRHASLFSGIGGFDLAASWMGWENVFQVEKDEYCRQILAKHFPDVERYHDIRDFIGSKYYGTIDIISGGFPCQPFSQAGKQKGKEDDRYLWPEMLRIIEKIKPTWVVGENVPGIISMALDEVLSSLEHQGYSCQTFVIPACAINAIHRRDRVWIIAHSDLAGEMRKSSECQSSSGKERIQERDKICISCKSDEISSIHATHSECNGSQNRCTIKRRALRCCKKGRMCEPKRKDSFSEHTKCDGQSSTSRSWCLGKTIYESQEGQDYSLDSKGTSCLSGTENDVLNTNIWWNRRDERDNINERSTPYGGQSQSRIKLRYPISKPTICRGDDGISYRLDDSRIISSRQRRKSLHALGNAIVPQVAYEIFKLIDRFIKHQETRK